METKKCNDCGEVLPLTDFQKGNGKFGKRTMCKKCCSKRWNTPERKKRKNEARQLKRQDFLFKQKEKEYNLNIRLKNNLHYLIIAAKARAEKFNMEFNITEEDLYLPKTCPLLNIALCSNIGKAKDNSYSIDRIDNNKGYIKGNVWIISKKANVIKNNANLEELELLVKNLKSKLK